MSLTVLDSRVGNSGEAWYAIRTRSNFEKAAADGLKERGIESFLPTYRARRQWSDRIKELELPLFPGYIFGRFDASRMWPVLSVRGVVHVVGAGPTPIPVEERELDAVRSIMRSGAPSGPWPFLQTGDAVTITRGALAGVTGTLLQTKGKYRLVVSVTILMRSVAVEIDASWIRPADRRRIIEDPLRLPA